MSHPSNKPAENLEDIFSYKAVEDHQIYPYTEIRCYAQLLAEKIAELRPPCADTTAAVRKVREAVMTANAAIALEHDEGADE